MSRAEPAARAGAGAVSEWWESLPRLEDHDRAFLPERTAQVLRTAISSGSLMPGTRLPEAALTSVLGVSRHTLRVAFTLLGQDGLTRREPNAGVSVIHPTLADIREIYRVRQVIEPGVVRSFPFGPGDLIELRSIAEAAESSEAFALAHANQDFHRRVVAQAGSEVLDAAMDRVLAQMRLAFARYDAPEYARYRERHLAIVGLLETGRTAEAARSLCDYLTDSEDRVIKALTLDDLRP